MAEFLDKARELFAANPKNECSEDLARVFGAISKLQSVHSKSELDIVNLESVFSAFEMADLLGVAPAVDGLLDSMKRVIAWTLDQTTLFNIKDGRIEPTPAYKAFAGLIFDLGGEWGMAPAFTVITFNYDLAVDVALDTARLRPEYGLTGASGRVNLFKLHGSVNWLRCPSCGKIVPDPIPARLDYAVIKPLTWSELKKLLRREAECCGKAVTGDCVIVPPSWNKAEYRTDLVNVWRQAARELQSATSIFVCGYSLPETDSFFRYLYGLGTVGSEPLERFWVYDPSEVVHARFRSMLGPGARARFEARPLLFEGAVRHMKTALLWRGAGRSLG